MQTFFLSLSVAIVVGPVQTIPAGAHCLRSIELAVVIYAAREIEPHVYLHSQSQ